MAYQHFTQNPSVTQDTISFTIKDGYHFDASIGEYVVVLDGEIVNYATHQSTATFQYTEALRMRRIHGQRCVGDIPYQGEPGYTTPIMASDEYALEAR